ASSVNGNRDRGAGWFWKILVVPALLTLMFVAGLNYYVRGARAERQRVYSELADLHVATLASTTPVDVVSTDRHTVKPWFEGKLPFTFSLPELQGSEFHLAGGRMAYVDQSPGAQLIFGIRKHQISVFIFQDRESFHSLGERTRTTQKLEFNLETWSGRGLRYVVISDAGPADVAALSRLLRDASL